jgi:transcriptional regulator with XRE-family HTH domain
MQRRMRYLRLKYKIPMKEIAACANVSPQRLAQVELGHKPGTIHMNQLVGAAFRRYIQQKREELSRLDADLVIYGNRLTEHVDERRESL